MDIDLPEEERIIALGPHSVRVSVNGVAVPELGAVNCDLRNSDYARCWYDDRRLLVAGSEGRSLCLAEPGAGFVRCIGRMNRFELDGYDPGGLQRLRFLCVGSDSVAVIYEVGMILVHLPSRRVAWHRNFEQLSTLYVGINAGIAWFEGDFEKVGFRLSDGEVMI